ncbi:heavy-metal-associated domain-containing protein [Williamwhitmania taraxaci]|uniref:Heavy-metal-associated domain-containing protein n=1 Tax=Williamwhitmania taraxaci TaxID=1640674 RepID=A0A1G6S794_9BACT|nr:cation transporter [Williamwhitmania taraxaci]SDD11997.1 Heavy-metal-associated domain-containing protein [Williamwhitmania taraxaci]
MRTVKLFIATLFVVALGATSFAQTQDQSKVVATKTESFTVSGKCGMCKTRIEKAAKVEGVSKAEWSDETKLLTIVYDPAKVTSDAIQKKIAAVGHDTEKYKADAKVYDALPGCCKYR